MHLIPVKGGAARDALDLPATLEAWEAARLFPRVGGYVRSWSQDIGAHVAAGQALGVIDTPELDQQIGQARAALASAVAHETLARSTAARWSDLLTTSSVSRQEVDEKNGDLAVKAAGVAEARAALSRLEAMKRYAVVRAPFAGVVTARNAEVGDLVGPGAARRRLCSASPTRTASASMSAYRNRCRPRSAGHDRDADRPRLSGPPIHRNGRGPVERGRSRNRAPSGSNCSPTIPTAC